MRKPQLFNLTRSPLKPILLLTK